MRHRRHLVFANVKTLGERFASRTGEIYGFAASGRKLFTIAAGATFDSYPAISGGGTLLVGGDDGVLRAIG
jgi:hypothetical protein